MLIERSVVTGPMVKNTKQRLALIQTAETYRSILFGFFL